MRVRRLAQRGIVKAHYEPKRRSLRLPSPRERWDAACARLVDAVMADDRDAARVAFAEALVLIPDVRR